MELIDKKGKTTAVVIFPVIKSVEENMNMLRRGMEIKEGPNWNFQSEKWSV